MMYRIKKILARQHAERIISRLHTEITIRDFLDGFCEHRDWGLPAIRTTEKAVGQGLTSWEEIGCSKEELESFCYWQLHNLFDLLEWSFQDENAAIHWHLSRQAIYGMERFRRLKKDHEEIVQHFDHCKIASSFWRRIFTLLHEERPHATDDELNGYICTEQTTSMASGTLWT